MFSSLTLEVQQLRQDMVRTLAGAGSTTSSGSGSSSSSSSRAGAASSSGVDSDSAGVATSSGSGSAGDDPGTMPCLCLRLTALCVQLVLYLVGMVMPCAVYSGVAG